MNNKSLSIRYFFYFVISFFLLILFLYLAKENEFNKTLDNSSAFLKHEYKHYLDEYEDISKIIYLNEFIRNKELIKVLKSDIDLDIKKNSLYSSFTNGFSFYQTLNIEDISFYDKNNRFILSMKNIPTDNFTTNIVSDVLKNKKDILNYKVEDEKIFLVFSKPIFDEKLNLIAIVNMKFNFHALLEKMSLRDNYIYNSFLSNNLKFEDSFILNISNLKKEELIDNINNGKQISFVLTKDLIKTPVIFFPIFKSDFYKNSIYLFAYDSSSENQFVKIDRYFDILLIVLISTLFLTYFLIFRVNSLTIQKDSTSRSLKNILNQIDNYIMMVETDLEGNITFVTKPFLKMSGYSKEELIGRNLLTLKHPSISDLFFQNLWNDLKINKFWQGEIKSQDKKGNSYWIKAVFFPKYDIDGEIVGYSSIRVNVTDTKQLEKINRILKDDLSSKLNEIKVKDKNLVDLTKVKLMSKIIDSLGHQWKKPISKVSFQLQKILEMTKNDSINKMDLLDVKENIDLELENLSKMLNEIKYLFNTKEKEQVDLQVVVNEVFLILKDEFKANNIKMKFDINSDILIKIKFNELRDILVNILKNSIEETVLNKQNDVSILISVIDEDSEIIIKIEDNIKGQDKKIIDEILSDIDEKYLYSPLYLSKLFIEKNKGLIWSKNTEYKTEFFIKLNK